MKHYYLLRTNDPERMILEVEECLKWGWECLGGVQVMYIPGSFAPYTFIQSLVHKKGAETLPLLPPKNPPI